jgi:hypothetical protein
MYLDTDETELLGEGSLNSGLDAEVKEDVRVEADREQD